MAGEVRRPLEVRVGYAGDVEALDARELARVERAHSACADHDDAELIHEVAAPPAGHVLNRIVRV
jgi:hypothetical protein